VKCDPQKLVDHVLEKIHGREFVSVIDSDMEIWDASRVGDRVHIADSSGHVWIIVGAPWESRDDIVDDLEEI
jgi:hypothetical protein